MTKSTKSPVSNKLNTSRKRTFSEIEDKLFCPWYFKVKPVPDWSLDSFDKEYCEIENVTKHISHNNFKSDLNILRDSFPDDTEIVNTITNLTKALKKSGDKKSLNYIWWSNKAIKAQNELNKEIIENKKQEALIEVANLGIRKIQNLGKGKGKASTSSQASSSASTLPIKDHKETDEIYINDSSVSVGNLIKNEAKNIHGIMIQNPDVPLTERERKIMTNGLSSILDLNDGSVNSQMSLFKDTNDWKELKLYFLKKHQVNKTKVNERISSIWKIVISSIKSSADITVGLKYINAVYYQVEYTERSMLDILIHLLKCIQKYPEYLTCHPPYEIRENDYLRVLWSPILESLIIDNKNIRLICSESCNSYGASNKNIIYYDSKNVISFKIDVRITVRCDDADYDLINGEAACHSADSKIIEDEGKLTREGKDIMDLFVEKNCCSLFPFTLQLVGPSIDISSLHLTAPGLYVCLPRYNTSLPETITDLEDIVPDFLENMYTLRSYILFMSNELSKSVESELSTKASLGKTTNTKITEMQYWTRPTYYTPPRNTESRISANLYGVQPASDIMEKLMKASFDSDYDDRSKNACQYGWIKKDGKYFNLISKEYSNEHFCCNS